MDIQDFVLDLESDQIPWRLFRPAEKRKDFCVLWLQGWTSAMDSHAPGVKRMVESSSLPFVTLDPAGHGQHKLTIDESTREQQQCEIVAIYDEVKKLGFQKIIVIGGSFGGYMAALLVAKRPVIAAVLRCPANYSDHEFSFNYKDTSYREEYATFMASEEGDEALKSSMATMAIANYDGYVYVLEHELDEVVPAKVPKRYFEVAKHGNYLIIPKTKHSPKQMVNPEKHFAYIEQLIVSILKAIELQDNL